MIITLAVILFVLALLAGWLFYNHARSLFADDKAPPLYLLVVVVAVGLAGLLLKH